MASHSTRSYLMRILNKFKFAQIMTFSALYYLSVVIFALLSLYLIILNSSLREDNELLHSEVERLTPYVEIVAQQSEYIEELEKTIDLLESDLSKLEKDIVQLEENLKLLNDAKDKMIKK